MNDYKNNDYFKIEILFKVLIVIKVIFNFNLDFFNVSNGYYLNCS